MSQRDWGEGRDGGGRGVVGGGVGGGVVAQDGCSLYKTPGFHLPQGNTGDNKDSKKRYGRCYYSNSIFDERYLDIPLNYFKKVLKELSTNAGHTKGRTTKRNKATILIF